MSTPTTAAFGSEPPRKVKGQGFRERYLLVGKSRAPLGPGVVVSILAHVAMFGGALIYAHLAPPRVVPEKPIVAKLVRLGKPRDEKLLPRLPTAPPPPAATPPVAVSTPNAPPPNPSATAKTIDAKPESPREKASEALERQKKLMEALERLGPAPTGPTTAKAEELPGQADGDKLGDAEKAAEGDRYLALVTQILKRSFTVPTTISEKERMYLKCELAIRISPEGKIVETHLETPSGNEQFDNAVESGAKRASLPAPPPGFLEKWSDGVIITYRASDI